MDPAQVRRDEREREERELHALIMEVHTAYPAYGAERITRRKRRNLTKPDRAADVVPDLIRRDFGAPMPGLKFVEDISLVRALARPFLHLGAETLVTEGPKVVASALICDVLAVGSDAG